MSRDCCVALPHDVTTLSAVFDCGISRSYSHTFLGTLIALLRVTSTSKGSTTQTAILQGGGGGLAVLQLLIAYPLHMSRGIGFQTMWYVRPAKPQINVRIRTV